MVPLIPSAKPAENAAPVRDELTLALYGNRTNVPDLLYRLWAGLPIYARRSRHRRNPVQPR
jgi:hypothetical protein